ncbi:MAG: BlaI/MecI/CopY family transcriptional regulator [Isosphaeraceae bacterium]
MARPPSDTLTEREAQLMAVLWDRGPATVEQVREAVADPLADSTVRTMLRILEAKGYVERDLASRAHVYRPVVDRRNAQRSAARKLVDRLFDGSAAVLVQRLVEDRQLDAQQIEELRRILSQNAVSAPSPPSRSRGGRS